jgi:lipopolysaccharide assembly outer membrane protein LptD (OstA)
MGKVAAGLTVLVLLLVSASLLQAQSGGRLFTASQLARDVTVWVKGERTERLDTSTGAMSLAGVVLMDPEGRVQINADRATYDVGTKSWTLEGAVRVSLAEDQQLLGFIRAER